MDYSAQILDYAKKLTNEINSIDVDAINRLIVLLLKTRDEDKQIFIMGNVLHAQKQTLPASYDINFITETICQLAAPYLEYDLSAAGVTIPGLADSELT